MGVSRRPGSQRWTHTVSSATDGLEPRPPDTHRLPRAFHQLTEEHRQVHSVEARSLEGKEELGLCGGAHGQPSSAGDQQVTG